MEKKKKKGKMTLVRAYLPEHQARLFKVEVAGRGLNISDAIRQAIQLWHEIRELPIIDMSQDG